MNKEIAADWVKALRSGKYTQGKGFLKDADGSYCCLGVLCEVAGETFVQHQGEGVYRCGKHNLYLPPDVRNKAGLHESHAAFINTKGLPHACLADANDNGMTFLEIADLIEQNVENL